MRVSRLEIFGFKSFVERFVLKFDQNFIGIVGPNGCGKSNVVDALRWVLGETSSRQLRGNSFEDLIFNGSENRRPLGMAEVSLVISTNEHWAEMLEKAAANDLAFQQTEEVVEVDANSPGLETGENEIVSPAESKISIIANSTNQSVISSSVLDIPGVLDGAEIQITRRVYRSGESEYFINRVACRLRDISDLLRLIGLGSRGLSIVQQGQIGEFLARKPVERRELLEDAAGISGFRHRLEAAHRKLDKTTDNMSRLRDIILEVEKQTRILKRQANRARARHELKALLQEAETELFRLNCAKIFGDKEQKKHQREQITQRIVDLENRLAIAEAAEAELQNQATVLDIDLATLRNRRDELSQTLNFHRERRREAELALVRHEGKEKALQDELERLGLRKQAILDDVDKRKEQIKEQEQRRLDIERTRDTQESDLARLAEETQAASVHADQVGVNVEQVVNSEREAEISALRTDLLELPDLSKRYEQLQEEISELRKESHRREQAVKQNQLMQARTEAQVQSIQQQLDDLAKEVKRRACWDADSASGQDLSFTKNAKAEVLAAGLKIPQGLEIAVAAVLGERGRYLLHERPEELAVCFYQASAKGEQRNSVKIGVISKNPPCGESSLLTAAELELVPTACLLLDSIEVESGFENAARALLADAILVNELIDGVRINEKRRSESLPERLIVTKRGEVVSPWGWYTTAGEVPGLSLSRKLAELQQTLKSIEREGNTLIQELERTQSHLDELLSRSQSDAIQRNSLLLKQRRLNQLLEQQQEDERRVRQEALRLERLEREKALAKEREAQICLRRTLAELAQVSSAIQYEQKRISSFIAEHANLEEQESGLHHRLNQHQEQKQELKEMLIQVEQDGSICSAEQFEEQILTTQEEIKKLDNQRALLVSELGQSAQVSAEIRRSLNLVRDEDRKLELAVEKNDIELSLLQQEFERHYPESVQHLALEEGVAILIQNSDIDTLLSTRREEANTLRRKLEREGEVDPQSIELYEQEQQRLTAMTQQLGDLETATQTLTRTIKQLKDISRERFLNTFVDVRGKFAELIPQLFGGGAGSLELISPEDPLNSGIEINVRLPGKKVSSMDLMSGGEKALVATAVLISTFLHRASPICVLDEVDAPLDDVNLDRFVNIIRHISVTTQCLIITHNKTTMSAVDRLIGVTMEEKGVSKAVSVTLAEAESELLPLVANG